MRVAIRWRLLAIGVSAYAVAIIAMLPASLADGALRWASSGQLRLAEAQGTLWSGSGQLEIRDAAQRTGLGKHVAWHVRPGALLLARLAVQIAVEPGAPSFPMTITWSKIELEDADVSLPAAALGLAVPKLAPLALMGDVRFQAGSISIGRSAAQGSGTLRWSAAGSALSPISPLGDYELRLQGDGPAVRATLLTLQGPLQIDGQGSWTNGSSPVFLGTARIPPQFQGQLAPLLRLIAAERGDGSFEFQLAQGRKTFSQDAISELPTGSLR